MSGIAVFGYGSLVSRESISRTLGHEAPPPIPARLSGWRRRWSIYRNNLAHEKVFERVDGEPFEHVVGLNIEHAPENDEAEWPNGALIAITQVELERLDRREVRYDPVEVTEDVLAGRATDFDRVFAYTAKPAHVAVETPPASIVIATYVRACREAFEALGPGQWKLFESTTGPYPAPVVEARLVRDEIPEGNPRDW